MTLTNGSAPSSAPSSAGSASGPSVSVPAPGKAPRFEALRHYFEGASVLNLGAVGGGMEQPDWIHRRIDEISSRTVGVDIHEPGIERAVELGFDMRYGDVTNLDLGDETFDVIFAGELIEHLDCVRGMFSSAARHLNPDGVMLITTPNAFSVSAFLRRARGNRTTNEQHTCWFCPVTMRQLVERCEFDVVDEGFVRHRPRGRFARGVFAARAALPDDIAWNTIWVAARPATTLR